MTKSKDGFFYIAYSEDGFIKFGVTKNNLAQRLRYAKKICGSKFRLFYKKLIKNMFKEENSFQWKMRNEHLFLSEFNKFNKNELPNILNKMLKILKENE
jgi:hypothetical protein